MWVSWVSLLRAIYPACRWGCDSEFAFSRARFPPQRRSPVCHRHRLRARGLSRAHRSRRAAPAPRSASTPGRCAGTARWSAKCSRAGSSLVLHGSLVAAPEHDVELVGERVFGDRVLPIERRDEPLARLFVLDAHEHRVVIEQRIAGEVHLRDKPLYQRLAEERKVNVRRPPGVVMVAPRELPRPDGHEAVPALLVGEETSGAR